MTKAEMNEAEARFAANADNVTDADVGNMLAKKGQVYRIMCAGPLLEYIEDVKTFFHLLADYWRGEYREVSFRTIAAIVGALAYLLSPIDVIPDCIPLIGYLDDAAVLGLCFKIVSVDIDRYRRWKAGKLAQ